MDDPVRRSAATTMLSELGEILSPTSVVLGDHDDDDDEDDDVPDTSSWVKHMLKHPIFFLNNSNCDMSNNSHINNNNEYNDDIVRNDSDILQSMLGNMKFDKQNQQQREQQEQKVPEVTDSNLSNNNVEDHHSHLQKDRMEEVHDIVRRLEKLEQELGLITHNNIGPSLDDDEVLTTFKEFAKKALVNNVSSA